MKGIVLLDLDETLHYSAKQKHKAWQHILNFFGFEWEISNANPQHELDGIEPILWPERGLPPHEFLRQLLRNLGLGLKTFDRSRAVNDISTEEQLFKFLQKEWSDSLIRSAHEMATEEVPGAVNMVKKIFAKDYHMGVITQAPTEYAEIILSKLGLLNRENPYINAIVGSEKVARPKPDPEGLIIATKLVWLDQFPDSQDEPPKALLFVGDSQSDELASANLGIPFLMIDRILAEGRIILPDGDTIQLDIPPIRGEKEIWN